MKTWPIKVCKNDWIIEVELGLTKNIEQFVEWRHEELEELA